MGHFWTVKDPPKDPDRDYFVPNFGHDQEVLDVNQSIAAGEAQHNHKFVVKDEDKAEDIKRNYFVPHFGADRDMDETKKSLALAEKTYGAWQFPDPPSSDPPRDYFVPHFGYDHDIEDSLKNLGQQEATKGKWNLPKDDYFQVQLDADIKREPLLTWAPTPPKTHKMNYFVPNFGADHDINVSKANEASAAEKLGHEWNPTKDKDGEWELPSSQIEFKLVQTRLN